MSKRTRIGFKLATKAALESDAPNFKVGAALLKSGKAISTGRNWMWKTHPDSQTRHRKIHAEHHCLIGVPEDKLEGATLFVVRVTCLGTSMAKPCEACHTMLKDAGITTIYYSGRDGTNKRLDLR